MEEKCRGKLILDLENISGVGDVKEGTDRGAQQDANGEEVSGGHSSLESLQVCGPQLVLRYQILFAVAALTSPCSHPHPVQQTKAADSTTQSVNKKLGFQDPYDAILPLPPSSLLLFPSSSAPSSLRLHYPDSFFHLPELLGSQFLTPCGGPSSSLETHRPGRTADSGDT